MIWILTQLDRKILFFITITFSYKAVAERAHHHFYYGNEFVSYHSLHQMFKRCYLPLQSVYSKPSNQFISQLHLRQNGPSSPLRFSAVDTAYAAVTLSTGWRFSVPSLNLDGNNLYYSSAY